MATIPDGTMVNLQATTVSIEPARLVSTGVIQISHLVDSSSSINITMWDNSTNLLELSVTYRFTNIVVRSFRDQKQLSLTKASEVTRIDNNIVFTAANKVNNTTLTINDAEIIRTKGSVCVTCVLTVPRALPLSLSLSLFVHIVK